METKVCSKTTCPHKGESQPLSEFSYRADKRTTNALKSWCKTCCNLARQLYTKEHPENGKQYRETHREQSNARVRKWQKEHHALKYERDCKRKQTLKIAAFAAYGGAICACCQEVEFRFLTIDHQNNDGAQHRRSFRGGDIYSWLKKNNYPGGFQVLCYNCNCGRYHNRGICPHENPAEPVIIPVDSPQ